MVRRQHVVLRFSDHLHRSLVFANEPRLLVAPVVAGLPAVDLHREVGSDVADPADPSLAVEGQGSLKPVADQRIGLPARPHELPLEHRLREVEDHVLAEAQLGEVLHRCVGALYAAARRVESARSETRSGDGIKISNGGECAAHAPRWCQNLRRLNFATLRFSTPSLFSTPLYMIYLLLSSL